MKGQRGSESQGQTNYRYKQKNSKNQQHKGEGGGPKYVPKGQKPAEEESKQTYAQKQSFNNKKNNAYPNYGG